MSWHKFLVVLVIGGILAAQPGFNVSAETHCDWAQFVTDLSIPDGTVVSPGAAFTKSWRLKNIGTCTWTTSYSLVFDSGNQMSATGWAPMPKSVAPGQTVDLSVSLLAPSNPGEYRGFWKLSNAEGTRFGIGTSATGSFWVDIVVSGYAAVAYDLAAYAPYAQWMSGAGSLPYPGTSGDYRGYAQPMDFLYLEDGTFTAGVLTVPHNKYNGFIQAVYPEYTVQTGDRFQAVVGCEFGSSCYVTYRLDYVNTAGTTKSFWSRREMNDGRSYQVNVDLTPLAGQTVHFITALLATGSADGDRAVWGAPRIVRVGGDPLPITPIPQPTMTASATPFFEPPPAIIPAACDRAAFVADITVPDGTFFSPGAAFTKTWRLKNVGSCSWKTDYRLVYYSGERMNASTTLTLPRQVNPGETVDLTVDLIAPLTAGTYRGSWVLSNAGGALFGIGARATMPFWVQINVSGEGPGEDGYDFVGNACAAQWRNSIVDLPCPGVDGDLSGFVLRQDAPHLEDGSISAFPGLLVAPQNRYDGYVQGTFPALTVLPGDRFQATVGCEYGASCNVTFRLDYKAATGAVHTFWTWREKNEGRFYNVDLDLSALVGQSVRFVLVLSAAGTPTGDRVVWAAPHIQRNVRVPTPTPLATFTPTPPSNDWPTYTNLAYGFQFKYPLGGQITSQQDNSVHIILPITAGTNLVEKYLDAIALLNVDPCRSPLGFMMPPATSETVIINGIPFLKETGEDGAVGSLYRWVAYSTARGNVCVSLDFVLHSINPGVYPTPPPIYDEAAESAVFVEIAANYAWLPATPTPTFTSAPLPDLTISMMRIELQNPGCLAAGDPMGVRVWVKNQGPVAATSFTVQVNGADQTVSGLGAGDTTAVFFPTHINPVTAIVDSSNLIVESDESNNSRSEMVPVPTPPFPCTETPTPTATPTQVALIGPYAVTLVSPTDLLNIRSGAGVSNPVIGAFPRDAMGVMRTGPMSQADGATWVEVLRPDGGTGWVNFNYLTEQVSRDAFCSDARIAPLIGQLKQTVNLSDGNLLAGMVSPKHGVNVNYWLHGMTVNYTPSTAATVFTSAESINWGAGPSGISDVGTFAQIVQPEMADVLNSSYQLVCDNPSYASMFVDPWRSTNIHYYAVVKPASSDGNLDWKIWLVGFEYVDGQPYLYGAVRFIWEP